MDDIQVLVKMLIDTMIIVEESSRLGGKEKKAIALQHVRSIIEMYSPNSEELLPLFDAFADPLVDLVVLASHHLNAHPPSCIPQRFFKCGRDRQ